MPRAIFSLFCGNWRTERGRIIFGPCYPYLSWITRTYEWQGFPFYRYRQKRSQSLLNCRLREFGITTTKSHHTNFFIAGGDNAPKTVSTSVFSKVLTVFSKVLTVFSKVLTVFLPDFTEEAGRDGFAFFFRFRVREWAKCPFMDTSCFCK